MNNKMSKYDFKINPESVSDEKISQYQDFEGIIRAHNIKGRRPYRRSSDVPLHRKKWVVVGFMAFCAIVLFGNVLALFTGVDPVETPTPVEKTIEPTPQLIEGEETEIIEEVKE